MGSCYPGYSKDLAIKVWTQLQIGLSKVSLTIKFSESLYPKEVLSIYVNSPDKAMKVKFPNWQFSFLLQSS